MAKGVKQLSLVLVAVFSFFFFQQSVNAQEYTITPDTTQEEIDTILASATSQDNITIASGDYSTVKNGKNYHKIITVQKDYRDFPKIKVTIKE